MLVNRSKEEIVHVEDEMKRFHCGLKNAEKKLEEQFENLLKSEDVFMRGKAFIMQSELKRIRRLLLSCHWVSAFETSPHSMSFDDIDETDDNDSESEVDGYDYEGKVIEEEVEYKEGESSDEKEENVYEDSELECNLDESTELDQFINFQFHRLDD